MDQPKRIVKKWPARPPKPGNSPGQQMPSPGKPGPPKGVPPVTFSKAPVAINSYVSGNKNRVSSRGGRTIVRHRELVATVVGAGTGFTLNNGTLDTYALNPANPGTFPWLSELATSYDTYNLLTACLEYVPLCNTGFVGRVALFYDRDSQDLGPFDRNELSNYAYLVETSPWAPATLTLPDLRGERFMRDLISTDDARLSDAGRIGWCTYNTGVGDVEGDIFICYEVELINAQPATSAVQFLTEGSSVTTPASFGPLLYRSIVVTLGVDNFWTFRLNTGTYFVTFFADFPAAGVASTTMEVFSGDASIVGSNLAVSNANRAADSMVVTVRNTAAVMRARVTGGVPVSWWLTIARSSPASNYTI